MKRSMEKKTFLTVYTYLHICLTYLSGYVGHAIFGTYRKYLEDVRVGSLRESSFNMTGGGDEDIETQSLKF